MHRCASAKEDDVWETPVRLSIAEQVSWNLRPKSKEWTTQRSTLFILLKGLSFIPFPGISTYSLFPLAQAAITNCQRLGGLNSKCLFLTVMEFRKSKVKVPADSVPVRASLLFGIWPPCYCVFTQRQGKSKLWCLLL